MRFTRRTFLKLAGVGAGTVALAGLWGCGSSEGAAPAAHDGATPASEGAAGTTSGSNGANVGDSAASSADSAVSGADSTKESANEQGEQPVNQSESASQQPETATSPETSAAPSAAVVYFSCTGHTQAVAEKVAQAADAPLLRLEAAEPYTDADLDYNTDCRANAEQDDPALRPAIAQPAPAVSDYDTVFLGYPIWWGKVPRVVLTYLESIDLAGKTVIPFCTSGSSSIDGSLSEVHAAAPDADWRDGNRFANSVSQDEIDSWAASFLG